MSALRARLMNDDGNVVTLYALLAPMLIFAGGAAIDYGHAAQIQSKLNAAADAAALAGLTPAMLQQSNTTAQTAVQDMFMGIADGVSGISGTSVNAAVTNGSSALIRNVTLTYSTSVTTLFGAVLGMSTLQMTGTSQASATIPPNIDFTVLLDNSPSMSLPATSAGITEMQNLTSKQGGCAFACHQASTNNGDTAGNPCADGTAPNQSGNLYCDTTHHGAQIDDFALARQNGIALRTRRTRKRSDDASADGLHDRDVVAILDAAEISLRDLFNGFALADRADAAHAADLELHRPMVHGFRQLRRDGDVFEQQRLRQRGVLFEHHVAGRRRRDELRQFPRQAQPVDLFPNPGAGSNQQGDTPQEVLFIVTDGVEDEEHGGSRIQEAMNDLGNAPGGTALGTNWCTTIKNRGIKIAILYTEYLPVPANSWYESYIAPVQSDIGPALQACASPGLFYDAAIGSDLGAALASPVPGGDAAGAPDPVSAPDLATSAGWALLIECLHESGRLRFPTQAVA